MLKAKMGFRKSDQKSRANMLRIREEILKILGEEERGTMSQWGN